MNKIMLTGRISKDIELRTTTTNKDVAYFSVAVTNKHKKNENGDYLVDFFDCIVWNAQAINLQKYQEKGDLIAIEGRLANQKWQDEKGNNRYKNIVICDSIEYLAKKNTGQQSGQGTGQQFNSNQDGAMQEDPFMNFGSQIELSDDDLPF